MRAPEIPDDLVATPADVADGIAITHLAVADLPANWRRYPGPEALRDLGTQWARERKTAVLAVPSAVIPQELNYLLNPAHPDFKAIRLGKPEPFSFDPRMWKG